MRRPTSAPLVFSERKGLHCCEAPWWIDLGAEFAGQAFALLDANELPIARLEQGGRLWALPGYLWDGSSGPTIDGRAEGRTTLARIWGRRAPREAAAFSMRGSVSRTPE